MFYNMRLNILYFDSKIDNDDVTNNTMEVAIV